MNQVKDIKKKYQDRIVTFKVTEDKIRKNLILLSVFRFLLFVGFAGSIVLLVKSSSFLAFLLTTALFFLFIFLVIKYLKQTNKRKFYQNLIEINSVEYNVIDLNFSAFFDGEKFINRNHPYSYDLDLFGNGSLYQYLNRTVTNVGRDLLANKLLKLPTKEIEIRYQQKAIHELSQKLDWRHNFLATAYSEQITKEQGDQIGEWIDKPVYYIKRFVFKFLVVFMPVATILAFFLSVIGLFPFSVFVFFALGQLFFAGINMGRSNQEQNTVTNRLAVLKIYAQLINQIESENFDSKVLNDLKKELLTDNLKAKDSFKKLIRIIDAFDTRLNLLLGVVLNGTLMWDLYSMMRLERWKLKYGKNIKKWIEVIAEFDVYISMANFAYNNPEFIYPIIDSKTVIESKHLGHPLINKTKRVNNDYNIDTHSRIDIITGANMAGKSTFLRTVGVNLILAHMGLPVCAKEFKFSIVDIFSGMRTADSLVDNESYFHAELKRLKYVIDALKQDRPTLILLDEILKGTNSVDKAKGSWKFVEHLIQLKATGIVATHDLTLCEIESKYPKNIKNKCFEVEIDGEQIDFDYKLKDGVTQNMNASILMKQMGLFKN